jgi:stearoyl-CoA desaturase (Delta-9 desaturase)
MVIILFFIAHWYLSLFIQTFFLHRYASHRAFTMSKSWERFFFVFGYLMQGSSYLSPRAYAVMHRMHHAFTDTEKDPHSPKNFSNIFSFMWQTGIIYAGIYDGSYKTEDRFNKNLPVWDSFEHFATSWTSKFIWIAIYVFIYVSYASSPWLFLLLPFTILMGPVHGAIINWYAHKFGYVNFKQDNTSRNLLPVDFLMLGESYHNDHHHNPSSINFGVRWYEVDPVYYVILLLEKLRVVRRT